ncbi:MAG: protein translocase subunit SecD, partial [Pontibacterium sp.]
MLNRFPLWKNILVIFVLVLGGIYAAPNIFPDDYAVQVSGTRDIYAVDDRLVSRVESALEKQGIAIKSSEIEGKAATIRVNNGADQLAAKEIIKRTLGDNYVSALNLVP